MSQKEDENKWLTKSGKQDLFTDWIRAMDRLFSEKPLNGILQSMDEFFSNASFSKSIPIELDENQYHYIVKAKLPGIKRQQIDLELHNQSLLITVQNEETIATENNQNHSQYKNYTYNKISRSITFAKPIDSSKVKANHQDGLLEIVVPKIKGKPINIE